MVRGVLFLALLSICALARSGSASSCGCSGCGTSDPNEYIDDPTSYAVAPVDSLKPAGAVVDGKSCVLADVEPGHGPGMGRRLLFVTENDRAAGGFKVFNQGAKEGSTKRFVQIHQEPCGATKVLDVLPLQAPGMKGGLLAVTHLRNTDLVVFEVRSMYRLAQEQGKWLNVTERARLPTHIMPSCGAAYTSSRSGEQYFFTGTKAGDIYQWRINVGIDSSGVPNGEEILLVQQFRAHPDWEPSDGRVAVKSLLVDDQLGVLWATLKGGQLRKFSAEPFRTDALSGGTLVYEQDAEGGFGAGLTLFRDSPTSGLLFASSQVKGKRSEIVAFQREQPHASVGSVALGVTQSRPETEVEIEGLTVNEESLVAHAEFKHGESGLKSSKYSVYPVATVLKRLLGYQQGQIMSDGANDEYHRLSKLRGAMRRVGTLTHCSGHGRRFPGVGCRCFDGFSGENCELFSCSACVYGTCVGPNRCICDDHHAGARCDHAVVSPSGQTAAAGKDADDPAIWVHPTAPERSLILGTTKSDLDSGIHVFSVDGSHMSFVAGGEPNSVDVLYDFPFGGARVDLAVAGGRASNVILVYKLDGERALLQDLPGGTFDAGLEVYGSCVYRSRAGRYYALVNSKSGEVRQFELFDNAGSLGHKLVRTLHFATQVEGMVADDSLGWLFVGEEKVGLWRVSADPEDGSEGLLVDHTDRSSGGNMSADIEGISLFVGPGDFGYIISSVQGEDAYTLHMRAPPHEFVGSLTIAANSHKHIDAVSHTDGLVVESAMLGPKYPYGALIVHDDETTGIDGTESEATFKIVNWSDIAAAFSPTLITNPSHNPRATESSENE